MSRPRSIADKEIRALHARNKTVQEIANTLDTSIVTVYKYLRRLGLKSNNGNERSDLRKFTEQQFREAHKEHDGNGREIANALKVSRPTVVRHAEQYGLKLKGHVVDLSPPVRLRVFNAYQAMNSIRDISTTYNLTPAIVRRTLEREVEYQWAQTPSPKLPKPTNLDEIKLYHLFRKFPAAIDDNSTETIATQAGHVRGTSVLAYVARIKKQRNDT